MSSSTEGSGPPGGALRFRAMFRGTGGYGMIRTHQVDARRVAGLAALNSGMGLEANSGFSNTEQEINGHAGKN